MLIKPQAILLSMALLAVSACSTNDRPKEKKRQTPRATIGELHFGPAKLIHDPLPSQDLQSLRDAYSELANVVREPQTQQIVQYRLADLELLLAEQLQETGAQLPVSASTKDGQATLITPYYDSAIAQYQQILLQHPGSEDNIDVLYQLAKAFDQQGQVEKSFTTLERLLEQFPNNPYLAEVYFRQGEVLFNSGDFEAASQAYQKVLEVGDDNSYYATSAYMLGWSHFKLEQQVPALLAFTRLLDHLLPNQVIADSALSQLDSQAQIDSLGRGESRLVTDTLHIVSLLFSYQDNEYPQYGDSIKAHFSHVGGRHYEYLLYGQLAQHYLNKDRYRDSAKVYQSFALHHPNHFQAPLFAVKQIDAYILGDFPTLVLPAKEQFVKQYGIKGQYWAHWAFVQQETVSPFLEQYIQELAQYEHSRAQLFMQASRTVSTKQDDRQVSGEQAKQQAMQAYGLAAQWYQEFIDTFEQHPLSASMTFSLGESLFESARYPLAIAAFERYAYEYLEQDKAVEAGYAAILAYRFQRDMLLKQNVSPEQLARWQDQQLLSQDKFVSRFAHDSRAVDVLDDSVGQLFALARYQDAIRGAQDLLAWQPKIDSLRQLANQLVVAHSQFALENYPLAEQKYQVVLAMLAPKDKRIADMKERLAASIYKQAESKIALNQLPLAVNDFLRILALTPNTTVRVNAQYDAARYLIELKEWQQASSLLEDFRQRFPRNALTQNIQTILIDAYQQNENWLAAANELVSLWQSKPKTEEGRQALYVAAQYYQKQGTRQLALEAYRDYAHAYPEPFDEGIEAKFAMSEFYRQSEESSKRRFWLKKILQAERSAKENSTPRAQYLAAMASMVFADDTLGVFNKIKLDLPLKRSLQKKKKALNASLGAYNQVLAYKITEFSTAANYRIAEIYHRLAKDLMASTKPNNLNELELEQYQILLEEQSYPFEEKAIDLHQTNAQRSWLGNYDEWVKQSFEALSKLSPGRFNKRERRVEISHEIY